MADHKTCTRTFSKVNLKYTKRTFPMGQARCSFHLPHSYDLQILLARGNEASTNVEPCMCGRSRGHESPHVLTADMLNEHIIGYDAEISS